MAALDFLLNSNREVTVAHFNHGTPHGEVAEAFIRDFCNKNNVPISVGSSSLGRPRGTSQEEHWRNQRYQFFNSLDDIVVTAHNLDDVCEWWIFTSLNGHPRLIPARNANVIRPFLLTPKEVMKTWCNSKKVPHVCDPSNRSPRYARSIIRHKIMPEALKINPGFRTVIAKQLHLENKGQNKVSI